MRRLWCWIVSHRWRVLRDSCHRAVTLTHLHPLAGTLAKCDRCGEVWADECMSCELKPRSASIVAEVGP